MNKKRIIIIILVILILFGIYMLYNTFAVSTIASNNESNVYNITIGEGTTITVPKGSSKTIYFHLKNTNNGSVKYALGYNTTANIEVKVYEDSKDKVSDIIGYTENKYIKLYLKNPTNTSSTVTLTSVLGYENGGDLIVPDGITLITEVYTPPVQKITLAKHITNLYTNASKTKAQNNGIEYNYASSESLMNDRLGGTTTDLDGGNIRYYGASPNNYIYFNCSDYNSQSSETCELWRIIGVFDGKVKIIKNESIGTYSWDTASPSENVGKGENEWPDAVLMKLLNPGHESEAVGGSLYYNSLRGACFVGTGKLSESCNFITTGIKDNVTKNKIDNANWYLGGWSTANQYSDVAYKSERSSDVYSGRSRTWTGKIALPYPSDYGYATDLSKCSRKLQVYDTGECSINNWMYSVFGINNNGWLLTPYSNNGRDASYVDSTGFVNVSENINTGSAFGVVPTLYLSSEQTISSGDGSESNPYKLSVN